MVWLERLEAVAGFGVGTRLETLAMSGAFSLSTVLATTRIVPQPGDPWPEPYQAPVAWSRQWGQGRIFITTIGHGVDDLRHPPVRDLIARGMLWAAR